MALRGDSILLETIRQGQPTQGLFESRRTHIKHVTTNGDVSFPRMMSLSATMTAAASVGVRTNGMRCKQSPQGGTGDLQDGTGPRIINECTKVTKRSSQVKREQTMDKIHIYNKKLHIEVFKIKMSEVTGTSFDGALRFYFDDGVRQLTKAIRLQNTTTVEELVPNLLKKFNAVGNDSSSSGLYEVRNGEENLLDPKDRPLEIALNARSTPRFVLRVGRTPATSQDVDYELTEKREKKILDKLGVDDLSELEGTLYAQAVAAEGADTISQSGPEGGRATGDKDKRVGAQSSRRKLMRVNSMPQMPSPVTSLEGRKAQRDREAARGTTSEIGESSGASPSALLITKARRKNDAKENQDKTPKPQQPHAKTGPRRNLKKSKTSGNFFQRNFSIRTKRETRVITEEVQFTSELSIEETAPGVLKIFGDSIAEGANYKSVLAASKSTAEELVKEALERYSIPIASSNEFVLCDVIGRVGMDIKEDEELKEDPTWQTECVRVIGNQEKPLTLQCFWKPAEGFARRFELRKRCDVSGDDKDEVTHGINLNARRMLLSRTRLDVMPDYVNLKMLRESMRMRPVRPPDAPTADDQPPEILDSSFLSSQPEVQNRHVSLDNLSASTTSQERASEQCSSSEAGSLGLRPPTDSPYLLLLRGYDSYSDYLLYPLAEQVTMLGSDEDVDICLAAPDIMPQHCWIFKKPTSDLTFNNSQDVNLKVILDPLPGAYIKVNNNILVKPMDLSPGDIVCLGAHYIFLFKDPTTLPEISRDLPWLAPKAAGIGIAEILSGESGSEIDGGQTQRVEHALEDSTSGSENKEEEGEEVMDSVEKWRVHNEEEYENDVSRLKLRYDKSKEDELLNQIACLAETYPSSYKKAPAYLFCMVIEYSSVRFDQVSTRNLLLKISGLVQGLAWDKTKELSSRQPEKPSDPHTTLKELLPDIASIIFWMSNSLEMLNYLQNHLSELLLDAKVSLPAGSRESLVSADDEVVSVLEEVVMYTFQQTVYYLTKTLYGALPAILDSNPFTEEDSLPTADPSKPSVHSVIAIFQLTYETVNNSLLHKEIVSQLFCYLFFFTSTSLFNSLLTKGSGSRYYKWSKGAQIRGNLDLLQSWAMEKNLQQEAHIYLRKINSVANLLARPKLRLMQTTWASIQREFPALNSSQLQHILCEYQLGPGKSRPQAWLPPPGETNGTAKQAEIMESFNNHPPLILPNSGFDVDLRKSVQDHSFYEVLQDFAVTFAPREDDEDSGLSGSTTLSHSRSASQSLQQQISVESTGSQQEWAVSNIKDKSRNKVDSGVWHPQSHCSTEPHLKEAHARKEAYVPDPNLGREGPILQNRVEASTTDVGNVRATTAPVAWRYKSSQQYTSSDSGDDVFLQTCDEDMGVKSYKRDVNRSESFTAAMNRFADQSRAEGQKEQSQVQSKFAQRSKSDGSVSQTYKIESGSKKDDNDNIYILHKRFVGNDTPNTGKYQLTSKNVARHNTNVDYRQELLDEIRARGRNRAQKYSQLSDNSSVINQDTKQTNLECELKHSVVQNELDEPMYVNREDRMKPPPPVRNSSSTGYANSSERNVNSVGKVNSENAFGEGLPMSPGNMPISPLSGVTAKVLGVNVPKDPHEIRSDSPEAYIPPRPPKPPNMSSILQSVGNTQRSDPPTTSENAQTLETLIKNNEHDQLYQYSKYGRIRTDPDQHETVAARILSMQQSVRAKKSTDSSYSRASSNSNTEPTQKVLTTFMPLAKQTKEPNGASTTSSYASKSGDNHPSEHSETNLPLPIHLMRTDTPTSIEEKYIDVSNVDTTSDTYNGLRVLPLSTGDPQFSQAPESAFTSNRNTQQRQNHTEIKRYSNGPPDSSRNYGDQTIPQSAGLVHQHLKPMGSTSTGTSHVTTSNANAGKSKGMDTVDRRKSGRSNRQAIQEAEMDMLLHKNTMSTDHKQVVEHLLGVQQHQQSKEDVFVVELNRKSSGLGLGLIDGMFTPLKKPGIYIRTLVPGGPAMADGRLSVGDRILAVNGTSLVGSDYQNTMEIIRGTGETLLFLVSKSDPSYALQLTASTC